MLINGYMNGNFRSFLQIIMKDRYIYIYIYIYIFMCVCVCVCACVCVCV